MRSKAPRQRLTSFPATTNRQMPTGSAPARTHAMRNRPVGAISAATSRSIATTDASNRPPFRPHRRRYSSLKSSRMDRIVGGSASTPKDRFFAASLRLPLRTACLKLELLESNHPSNVRPSTVTRGAGRSAERWWITLGTPSPSALVRRDRASMPSISSTLGLGTIWSSASMMAADTSNSLPGSAIGPTCSAKRCDSGRHMCSPSRPRSIQSGAIPISALESRTSTTLSAASRGARWRHQASAHDGAQNGRPTSTASLSQSEITPRSDASDVAISLSGKAAA